MGENDLCDKVETHHCASKSREVRLVKLSQRTRGVFAEDGRNDLGDKVETHHCASLLIYDEAIVIEETESDEERESDEEIAPIGASCHAARKAGRTLNKAHLMRFEKKFT